MGVLNWITPLTEVFNRAGEDFAIGNIAVAFAHLGADAFDAEGRSVPGPLMWTRSALFMRRSSGTMARAILAVIHGADIEIEIFESFGAHAGGLGHAWRGPAQGRTSGFCSRDNSGRAACIRE